MSTVDNERQGVLQTWEEEEEAEVTDTVTESLRKMKVTPRQPYFSRGYVSLSVTAARKALPIYSKKDEILQTLENNQVVIIQGATGSGKTTQLVQYLAEAGYAEYGWIGCTQPRRIAARAMATRVAKECGVEVGGMVGYAVRFNQEVSRRTAIKFLTDGMLVKDFNRDQRLENYSVIIIDEAHERSVSSDICLGLIKRILPDRPDLRIIVASATLNTAKFSAFFNNAPIIKVSGMMFPVKVVWSIRDYEHNDNLWNIVVKVINTIVRTEPMGDVLVFLSGAEEINTTWTLLEIDAAQAGYSQDIEILPCHGSMSLEDQDKIFAKLDVRKIILATNVAETSLTVDGIKYVVDCGYYKLMDYNSKTGIETLKPQRITKQMAVQRSGRAGRTAAGKVYRLYSETKFQRFAESQVPDILRSNIESTVLDLMSLGIKSEELIFFPFIDAPHYETLIDARLHLQDLGALDEKFRLTPLGSKMSHFPIGPPLAKTLLTSADLHCSNEVLSIVSLLSTPIHMLFMKGRAGITKAELDLMKTTYGDPMGDHLFLLNLYEELECNNFNEGWCRDMKINVKIIREAAQVRRQLVYIMAHHGVELNSLPPGDTDKQAIRRAFAAGFFRRLAVLPSKAIKKTDYITFSAETRITVSVHSSSVLSTSEKSENQLPERWLLYHELRETHKLFIHSCVVIKPEWIQLYAPLFWKRMMKSHRCILKF